MVVGQEEEGEADTALIAMRKKVRVSIDVYVQSMVPEAWTWCG